MKRWLIVLCLAAATAPGFAAAATRSPEDAPLWKRLLAVIVPSALDVRQPAAAKRHRRQAHTRLAAHDAVENSPPLPRATPQPRDRHEHVGLAATGAEENSPPLPRPAPQPRDRHEHVGLAATGAEENLPPLLPAPDVLPVPARSAASSNGCEVGQRIISAYYWQGRHTASGEPFNPQGMTAAHRTLPFGTRLNVINPRTGQSVTVVINDRGPFVRGVSLDLSVAAAKAIGMHGTGTVCIL
jgi:peptidoglycan lytic transglycosylase